MKKVSLFLCLICCFVFCVSNVNAMTLDQYIAKAEAALNAKKAADEKKKMTENEKNKALAEKAQIEKDIETAEQDIKNLQEEIKNLKETIKTKDKEIKEVMKFVQISEGSSTYLEYIFGASSFTDFIYRISVAEQLSDYNDKLITEYNNDVKNLENKQTELNNKKNELTKKESELSTLVDKLSSQIEDLSDASQSYNQEYNNFMSYVNQMRKMGCRGSDELSVCKERLYNNNSNASGGGNSSGYYIPLTQGRVTQDFKEYYKNGKRIITHNAVDIANYEGAPVYPMTDGDVIRVTTGCGENVVYIVHKIGGKRYTTVYYHLKTVTVNNYQHVYYNTQIGTQGGNPAHGATCGCTGSHVDVKLFSGEYLEDFFSLTGSDGVAHTLNPRTWLTQLPRVGGKFSHR